MVTYVKDNLLNGCCFSDLADLNAQAQHWLSHTPTRASTRRIRPPRTQPLLGPARVCRSDRAHWTTGAQDRDFTSQRQDAASAWQLTFDQQVEAASLAIYQEAAR